MKLSQIAIRRVPGIDRPFTLRDLNGGINLIVGPNGSGKTTIVRALRATLWPDEDPCETIAVDSHWISDGQAVVGLREGRRILWQREGKQCSAPTIPDERAARCLFLGMADLIVDPQRSDPGIAVEIRRQMAGGYDVPRVIQELFTLRPRHGQAEESALRRARADLAELRSEHNALAEREDRLDRLEQRREAARRARAELQLLERAREHAEARFRAGLLESDIAGFPAGIENLKGEENRRLAEMREQLADVERRTRSCEARIDEARAALAKESRGRPEIDAVELEAMLDRARDLQAHEAVIQEASRDFAAAHARLERTATLLGPAPTEGTAELTRAELRELELLLREAARVEGERDLVGAQLDLLGPPAEVRSSRLLQRGVELLSEWELFASAASLRSGLIGVAGLLGVAGLVAGFFHPAGGWVVVAALGALAAALLEAYWRGRSRNERRRGFADLDLDAPSGWNREAVRARRAELSQEWESALRSEQERERRRGLEGRLERLERAARGLQERRRGFSAVLGCAGDPRELELALVAQELLARQVARADCADARARLQEATGIQEEGLDAIRSYLKRYGFEGVADAAAALARLSDLREQARRIDGARETIRREESERAALDVSRRAWIARIAELFRRVGLGDGDEAELERRLALLDDYRRKRSDLEQCRRIIAEHARRLTGRPELLQASPEAVAELRLAAERQSESLDELAETIGSIRRDVETARSSRRFEEQTDRLAEAERRHAERVEEALLARAGSFLLAQVRAEYDANARPEVLRRAADLFRRFTRNRYRLDLDTEVEPPVFRALETRSGIGRSLDELSDGTRVQLLLAARLAFAAYLDSDNELPLVLDEVLTTSDPERFLAVAESLRLIATEEGRQVVYLTSNPADAAMWNQVLKTAGEPPLEPIDLARVRRLAYSMDAEQLSISPIPAPPRSGGLSPEEYGARLEVPRLDPFEPADSIHLFHLLREELPTLEALLREGVETVGQLRYFFECGEAHRLFGDETAARLAAMVELAESFLAAWRIGRGRRLDENALRQAGATETFLPRLNEIVEQVDGDAARFLDILEKGQDPRTRRLRSSRRAEIREHLIAAGYHDGRRVLEESDLAARVLAGLAGRIRAGHLGRDEVRHRVHELFDQAGPRASRARAVTDH